MRFLVDLDVTLNTFLDEWRKRYNEDYNDTLQNEDITDWDMSLFVKPECGKLVYKYLSDPMLFLACNPLPYSRMILENWVKCGLDVQIVTAVTEYTTIAAKYHWILVNYPFLKQTQINVVMSKGMVKGDVMIDDGPLNLKSFTGGVRICVDAPYNRDLLLPRAKDWLDIADMVEFIVAWQGNGRNPLEIESDLIKCFNRY